MRAYWARVRNKAVIFFSARYFCVYQLEIRAYQFAWASDDEKLQDGHWANGESLPCVLFAALEEPISNIVIQIEIG